MRVSFVFITLIIFVICDNEEFKKENEVLTLNENNFDKALEKYEYLMVLFYSPSCEQCKQFYLEYEKAATILQKDNLFLSKVDNTTEKKLIEKYALKDYPFLKFFIKGKPINYTGGHTEKDIITWIRKNVGPSTKPLKTIDEVETFIKENEICVIYFGNNNSDIEEFTKVSKKFVNIQFATVDKNEIIQKYTKPGTVVLFKPFNEKKNEMNIIKEKEIEDFVYKYMTPKIEKSDKKEYKIPPGLVIFVSQNSTKWEEYEKLSKKLSEQLKGKLFVIFSDIEKGDAATVSNLINVKNSDLPTVRIVEPFTKIVQYKMEGEINEKNILKFVDDWEKDKLKPLLKSEEEPKENNGDIFVVVGKTYEKEVIKNDKDILILFYSPLCEYCDSFHIVYEEVAKKLKQKNSKLVIAKINIGENEQEYVSDAGLFTIKFYPGNKKDKEPLHYDGKKTVEEIIEFIKKNAHNKIEYEEEKKEGKEEKKEKKEEKNPEL